MSSYFLFLILGLGSGATYAILGQGLVLKYRSAGVVDFAHGAVAMFIAYVFVNLRSFGQLELPVVLIRSVARPFSFTTVGACRPSSVRRTQS